MEKNKISTTLLYKNLYNDLDEFGISNIEVREKILKNSLEPQNYQEIYLSETLNSPFLEVKNNVLYSKKEIFIRSGIKNKIQEIFYSYKRITPSENSLINKIFDLNDEQSLALDTALKTPFFILTGGPGTGKTTTAAAIIVSHILAGISENSISVIAPTGRAAGRITESLLKSFEKLKTRNILKEDELNYLLSIKASTIHRLLSYSFSKDKFFKNSKNPIQSRLILLDEASMVSPELFFSLMDAIPEGGKIILLGDSDQLPPVESQKFFKPFLENKYFTEGSITVEEIKDETIEIKEKIARVSLIKNHRTNSQNLIEFLNEIKSGKVNSKEWIQFKEGMVELDLFTEMNPEKNGNVIFLDNNFFINKKNAEKFLDFYKSKILNFTLQINDKEVDTDLIWKKISTFQILCALKQSGFVASDFINQYLESKFRNTNRLLPRIMMYNNYNLNIFNGDMGSEHRGTVYFPINGKNQKFPKALNGLESAFAITVHKSQGSQYENVVLILPDDPFHELNTKALLYTGASRTIRNLLVIANQTVLNEAVKRV